LARNEGLSQGLINIATARTKFTVSLTFGFACERADGINRLINIGEKIEGGDVAVFVTPTMSRQYLCALKGKALIEALARIAEQAFKHPSHGKDCGPAINLGPTNVNLPHLTAWSVGALKHSYIVALTGKISRSRKATHASANDNDFASYHGTRLLSESPILR
jgi:hypothetical protein